MKTSNCLNIFCAVALAFLLNGCARYPAYEISDLFFLNKEYLDMYLGDTVRIIASPSKASYVWTSENDTIASVDQTGLVKAMNYGLTSIIVKSGNVEEKIDVRVLEFIPLTGITVSIESVRISPGNTFKIWAYPDPIGASEYSLTWRSENPEIATVDKNGMVYAVSGGWTNIIVGYGDIETVVPVSVISSEVVLMEAIGLWLFDDPENLLKATIGYDLVPKHRTGGDTPPVYYPVIDTSLKAITVAQGTYFNARHGMKPGEGQKGVNEYTLMFDFKIPQTGLWYSFFQTTTSIWADDAECMINSNNQIGIGIPGYSTATVSEDIWYRLIIAVKLPSSYDIYLDGTRIFTVTRNFTSISVDSRFAIGVPDVMFFCDNDSDDNEMDVSAVAIWDHRLVDEEISILGKANKYE
jgi:hypothetical protein